MSDTSPHKSTAEQDDVLDRRICINMLSLIGVYKVELENKLNYFHNNWLEMSHTDYREYRTRIEVLQKIVEDLTTAMRG